MDHSFDADFWTEPFIFVNDLWSFVFVSVLLFFNQYTCFVVIFFFFFLFSVFFFSYVNFRLIQININVLWYDYIYICIYIYIYWHCPRFNLRQNLWWHHVVLVKKKEKIAKKHVHFVHTSTYIYVCLELHVYSYMCARIRICTWVYIRGQ